MTKTVLFVTYGGGHAPMVAPVIRALQAYPDIHTEVLALTLGGPYFKRLGLPHKGFKDFITTEDQNAIEWGKKLAALHHQPETGIEEQETVAYLGLSYWDLVTRVGEAQAARLWEEKKRNAFFPISVIERVIARIKPDMVVTTNSPRSEYAAQVAANRAGIPTLAMYDLFGSFNFYRLEADYVAVISAQVIENLKRSTGLRDGQKFIITGNPAFDQAFDYRGPVDVSWRETHFPSLPENAKCLLLIDEAAYIHKHEDTYHYRTDKEITDNLDALAVATKSNNGFLLIRPHPSQQRTVYYEWMKNAGHAHVFFAGDVPLYPLLNACDAVITYASTVSCEALLMQRPLIQINYYPGKEDYLPLGKWGVARLAKSIADLPEIVRQCFYENDHSSVQTRIAEIFPQERAAPTIAAAIVKILSHEEPAGVR